MAAPGQVAAKVAAPSFRTRAQSATTQYFNGAVYGDYGIGKTYLSGTIDRYIQGELDKTDLNRITELCGENGITPCYRTIFANAEKGEEGLPRDCEDIIIKDIFTYKEFARLYDFLNVHCKLVAKGDVDGLIKLQSSYFDIPTDYPQLFIFKACIIDSLTEIQKYCLYQLLNLDIDSPLDQVPDYMQQRQWGSALEMILLMVRSFRALPMFKLFIIQQVEDQDERKQQFFKPALQGSAKASILGFFDFCGYYTMAMDATNGVITRRLFLLPAGRFKAKHRFENFPSVYLDNPSLEILAKLRMSVEPIALPTAAQQAGAKPGPGRPGNPGQAAQGRQAPTRPAPRGPVQR